MFEIPKITDEKLQELLLRIRPVLSFGGKLSYIKSVDPRHIAFLWDPKPDGEAEDLVILRSIRTYHDYGHPSLFKPSIAEVLAQIPEDILDKVVAFETMRDAVFDQDRDCHEAVTVLYRIRDKVENPILALERYIFLKQELVRVRDKWQLYECDKVCHEEDSILDEMDSVWNELSDQDKKELDNRWDCCGGSLNYLANRIAEWSESKGWETNWWNVPEKLMLVVTELAEAMEEYRELGDAERQRLENVRKRIVTSEQHPLNYDVVRMEHYPKFRVEIADTVIRLLNLSASLGIDIEAEIADKMKKNEKRPFKHGGKNC